MFGRHLLPWIATAALGLAVAGARAQSRTTNDGVYSEAQATRGLALYGQHCASCHGPDLQGHDDAEVPALVNEHFDAQWAGEPLTALYRKVSVTMPARAPGSLQPREAIDIVAYLLKENRAKAGATELAPDPVALAEIRIQAGASAR